MSRRVLIVGQGLAGTALGLECEAAGIDFLVASAGHGDAASRVAAGLINPVTGQRWVKSAQIDELRPIARECYSRWGRLLGADLWHDLKLTRLYRDAAERQAVEVRIRRGDLAPWTGRSDDRGVEIVGAAWVVLPAMLERAARRWLADGRLRETAVAVGELKFTAGGVEWGGDKFAAAVLCGGSGALGRRLFDFVPFAPAKGEMLSVRGCGLPSGQALNHGVWLISGEGGTARIGATYERGRDDAEVTSGAREQLLAQAAALGVGELQVTGQSAGVRLTLPDRMPVVGWHPRRAGLGIFGGLGSKGSLWAPALARRWCDNLVSATKRFPPETSVERWWNGGGADGVRLSVEN